MSNRHYIFDIESDNLLDKVFKIHCIVTKDISTGEVLRFNDQGTQKTIAEGLELLKNAESIIGHNIINFDIPCIQKLYRGWTTKAQVFDTMLMAKIAHQDITEEDFQRNPSKVWDENSPFPAALIGRHSLKAWGYRLGILKGTFKEDGNGFAEWSQEMEDYCEKDVLVTEALWKYLDRKELSQTAIQLEHKFAQIVHMQEQHGFAFDVEKAKALNGELLAKRIEIEKNLQKVFPPRVQKLGSFMYEFDGHPFTTKIEATEAAKQYALKNGTPVKQATSLIKRGDNKTKEIPFNPSSRDQIAERLQELGWKPTDFTDSGKPTINDSILEDVDIPEAKALNEYLLIQKRIGQLSEGAQALMKSERNGRIHGSVDTNGCVTGRCTHKKPNMAQIPRVGSPYGSEFRGLLTVTDTNRYNLIGADASGLELRCLAHYMGRYDGGAYAKVLLEGDIHTENQNAAGLPTRNDAKTFIYAFLYGAGDEKIGTIVGKTGEAGRRAGKVLKENFLKKLPALGRLKKDIEAIADSRGYLVALDGRRLPVRSSHAALNTLLQSAGALVMKKATCIAYEVLISQGLVWGDDWAFVANVHDEWQAEVKTGLEEKVGSSLVESIRQSGRFFKFRCPLDGEWKQGKNWSETH